MSRTVAVIATLAAGALVAFQPPANAELGKRVGVLGAAFISVAVSLLIVGVILVIAGKGGELRDIGSIKPVHLIVSALLDRIGVLGLSSTPLEWPRLLGFAFLIAGTVLVTLRPGEG